MLSREPTAIPETEARTLVRDLDSSATFRTPEPGLLLADTSADPAAIEARVAFSRRVGVVVPDGRLEGELLSLLRRGSYRVRVYGVGGPEEESIIRNVATTIGGRVSLDAPDREVSAYVGKGGKTDYLMISSPGKMEQAWVSRRPRSRAFFHPSAIFPKLSRALVNFSGVQPGETFLDPFCGTGSLLIEASIVGAEPIGVDIAKKMARGARRNSMKYGQPWLGVLRADSRRPPVRQVSAISTDIPYGRAASAAGSDMSAILASLIGEAPKILAPRRKLVVMHPKHLPVPSLEGAGMSIESQVDIYIHRTLTRRISVMRRDSD